MACSRSGQGKCQIRAGAAPAATHNHCKETGSSGGWAGEGVAQARVGLLQRMLHLDREAEILEPAQGQPAAKITDRRAQFGPGAPRALEQAYFVFREEDGAPSPPD